MSVSSVTLIKDENLQCYTIGRAPAACVQNITCKGILAPNLVVNFRAADVAHNVLCNYLRSTAV